MLASPLYPSSIFRPLDFVHTLSGKGYKQTNRRTNVTPVTPNIVPDNKGDCRVWKRAASKGQSADVQRALPIFGGRIPAVLSLTDSDANSVEPPSKIRVSGDVNEAPPARSPATRKQKSRIPIHNETEMLPKLASLVKQARERSHCVKEFNRVGAFVSDDFTTAMVGRSTPDASPKCESAADSPFPNSFLPAVVMDMELDVESPLLLSRHRPKELSSGSTQLIMSSVRSSSSSAQSSPLCVTPELPSVSLPSLAQSVPHHHMYSKDSILFEDQVNSKADVNPLESLVARMTLHRNDPSIDTKLSTTTLHSHRTSDAASLLEKNTSWRAEQGPSYLSRSQRRLARAVVNPLCHDVQSYLYKGGQTSVVSGGVMLGSQVQGRKPGQNPSLKGREQHLCRKSKKAQRNNRPQPKDAA